VVFGFVHSKCGINFYCASPKGVIDFDKLPNGNRICLFFIYFNSDKYKIRYMHIF